MRRILQGLLVWCLICLAGLGNHAEALRCGNRIVSRGDTKTEVIFKCGEPTSVESWEETETFLEEIPAVLHRRYGGPKHLVRTRIVVVEEWLNNFGPHNLIHILRFYNSRVSDMRTGDYGY